MSNSIQPQQNSPPFVMMSPVQAAPTQRPIESSEQAFPSMNGTTIAATALVAGALVPVGIAAYLALGNTRHSSQVAENSNMQADRNGKVTSTTPASNSIDAHLYADPPLHTDRATGLTIEQQKKYLCGMHALNNALMALGENRIPIKTYLEAYEDIPKGADFVHATHSELANKQITNEHLCAVIKHLQENNIINPMHEVNEINFENAKAGLVVVGKPLGSVNEGVGHWFAIVKQPQTEHPSWHIVDSRHDHPSNSFETFGAALDHFFDEHHSDDKRIECIAFK